jgi:CBS domain-containing protein
LHELIHPGKSRMGASVPVFDPVALPVSLGSGMSGGLLAPTFLRALQRGPAGEVTVLEAGSGARVVAYPDETIHEAMAKMLDNNIGRLPVVERGRPHVLLGYLGRAEVMAARQRHHVEEHVREPGWFSRTA